MSNAFTEQPNLPSVLIDRKAIMAANPAIDSAMDASPQPLPND